MKILLKSIHEHVLHFHEFVDQTKGYSCTKCGQGFFTEEVGFDPRPSSRLEEPHITQHKGLGSAFSCEDCGFWLHYECVDFPSQIEEGHPLHSKHPLYRTYDVSLCNKCSYLFDEVPSYRCYECSVSFDFGCIFPTNDEHPTESGRLAARETERENIRHFCHEEKLHLCKGMKLMKKNCLWCNLAIDDDHMIYVCLKCRFILHESCLNLIPKTVKHPFHPLHPLRMKYRLGWFTKCNACKNLSALCSPHYLSCEDCNFFLHVGCANFLKPNLIHPCHEHKLSYFRKKDHEVHSLGILHGNDYPEEKFVCKSCGIDCALRSTNGFYRCVECDVNFHVECVPIPGTAKHENHIHSLTLMNSFLEDDFKEYYCDICEERRDEKHHVYCCKECKYAAHIRCVLYQEETSPEADTKIDEDARAEELTRRKEAGEGRNSDDFPALSEQEEAVSNIDQSQQLQFSHFHKHPLRAAKVYDDEHDLYCNRCREKLYGSVYTCISCQFHLHKNCVDLPPEIIRPHSQHTLTLLTTHEYFACNACGCISSGFYYYCEDCELALDLKCARTQDEGQKECGRKTTHYDNKVHEHELELVNCVEAHELECARCQLQISGPVYCCFICSFFIHESCTKLPKKIEHPCHPHPLLARKTASARCRACKLSMDGIKYFCRECNLSLHHICADSLTRALKHNSHKHKLFYFGKDMLRFFQKYGSRTNEQDTPYYDCNLCGEICDRPFYRCVKCRINLHLECMQIPPVAKSKSHIHALTLTDSFVEDDLGQYYCDACETERNPDHHVYYCKECKFFAHVECVLCEEEVGDPEKENGEEEGGGEEEEEERDVDVEDLMEVSTETEEESDAGEENSR